MTLATLLTGALTATDTEFDVADALPAPLVPVTEQLIEWDESAD
jgi:hypothetical protein